MAAGDVNVDLVSPNAKAGAFFDGVDDVANSVGTPNPNILTTTDCSISLWVLSRSVGEMIIFENGYEINKNLIIWWDAANGVRASFYTGAGYEAKRLSAAQTLNTWHHIVYTFSSPTTGELYVDGVKATLASNGGSALKSGFAIGNGTSNSTNWFNGNVSDLKVYNRVLSEQEAINTFGGEHITEGLTNHYPLISDYNDVVSSFNLTNTGSRLGIYDSDIAAAIKAARVTANDTFLLTECANGLQVVVPSIEEAP